MSKVTTIQKIKDNVYENVNNEISGQMLQDTLVEIVNNEYTELAAKQDKLVSGTNIKTVNNNSLVGSGNVSITPSNIGAYTKAEADALLNTKVAKTQKVNNKALTGDITLNAADVGALADTTKYAASNSVGGAAVSADKVNSTLTVQQNGTAASTFNGSTNTTVNITASGVGAYTKAETDTKLAAKQDTLVSGTNIKTVNNNSLLGSGDLAISGGTSGLDNYIFFDSRYVGSDSDGSEQRPFNDLQKAINLAETKVYGTIFVAPANMIENVVINKSIRFVTEAQLTGSSVIGDNVIINPTAISVYFDGFVVKSCIEVATGCVIYYLKCYFSTPLNYTKGRYYFYNSYFSVTNKVSYICATTHQNNTFTFNGCQMVNLYVENTYFLAEETTFSVSTANQVCITLNRANASANYTNSALKNCIFYSGDNGVPIVGTNWFWGQRYISINHCLMDLERLYNNANYTTSKDYLKWDDTIKKYEAQIRNLPITKQDTLVSGTNIKTINGNSLLGSGDITISGGESTYKEPKYEIILTDLTQYINATGKEKLKIYGMNYRDIICYLETKKIDRYGQEGIFERMYHFEHTLVFEAVFESLNENDEWENGIACDYTGDFWMFNDYTEEKLTYSGTICNHPIDTFTEVYNNMILVGGTFTDKTNLQNGDVIKMKSMFSFVGTDKSMR